MFERSRVDNTREQGAVAAHIVLDDGRALAGRFVIAMSKTLIAALNEPSLFIEFEPYGGEREFVAKSALRSVKAITPPGQPALGERLKDLDGFDPYHVLGVAAGAPFETVRAAFHKLALEYHPDRYASAQLPREVAQYLDAMVRRINAAYAALEAAHQVVREVGRGKTAPIYESARRA